MNKVELRKLALQRRDALSVSEREEKSKQIFEHIRRHSWYEKADIVFSYASFRSEVSTEMLNEQILSDGKKLFLPRTDRKEKMIHFFQVWDMTSLQCGYQGIMEPQEMNEFFDTGETLLMLMPGVAYDEAGSRIGYGGGYYDKYLQTHQSEISHTLLLAFSEQQVPVIPVEWCDRKPELIVNETGFRMEEQI